MWEKKFHAKFRDRIAANPPPALPAEYADRPLNRGDAFRAQKFSEFASNHDKIRAPSANAFDLIGSHRHSVVFVRDGEVFADGLDVAAAFDKSHNQPLAVPLAEVTKQLREAPTIQRKAISETLAAYGRR
jgi:hypothetical protein